MRILLEHEPGTQMERTFGLLKLAETREDLPGAVRALYRLLGDLFPTGDTREVRLATEKQLRYISLLAGLDWGEWLYWRESARCQGLDMAQASWMIRKLTSSPKETLPDEAAA